MIKMCFVTTVSMTLKAFVLNAAKYLHEHGGYEITFICNPDDEFQLSLPSYIKYRPVIMNRGISISGIKSTYEIYKILKTEKYDIVQYSTPNASLYTSIAAAISNIQIRLYCQWGIAYTGFSGIKRNIFKLVEKLICGLSTEIQPDSYGNLRFSYDEGLYTDKNSEVIWNGSASGVDLNKFNILNKINWKNEIRKQLDISTNSIVFGFVGRINQDKGINELLSATRDIILEYHNFTLLLIGQLEQPRSINQELYQWSIDETRVIYCGFTNSVEKYISAMDVFVLPSYREGFGSVVIEAEAMGVPVIVTDIPGPTDAMIVNKTGLIVKKADISSLKNAMISLYQNNELRENYGEAAHSYAIENFNQDVLFRKILENREKLVCQKY